MDRDARDAKLRLFAAAAAILVVLAGTAVLLARLASEGQHSDSKTTDPSSTTIRSGSTTPTVTGTGERQGPEGQVPAVYRMPKTGDPIEFGTAYVKALLTYDTTKQTLAERRAWLMAWTPPDGFYSDAGDMLDDFLGTNEVWRAAKAAHQSQTVIVQRAWIPESQKQLEASTPEAKEKATRYPTIVTATVLRQVRGDPGANQDLPLTISVIVSCPPDEPCVAYAPGRRPVVN